MHKEYLMGNQAIAYGAIAAGVNLVAGYPGTPSTEVLETVAKIRPEKTYVDEYDRDNNESFLDSCAFHFTTPRSCICSSSGQDPALFPVSPPP